MTGGQAGWWSRLERYGRLAESAVLVILLAAMVVLAALQIGMRNVFGIGWIWSDELLRIMVLWITLAGAVAASRDDHHIRIDILSRFLPAGLQRLSKAITDLFTALVAGFAAYGSFFFVKDTFEFADTILGGLPAWLFQSILPLGFALIAYRYGLRFVAALLLRPAPETAA